MPARVTRRSLLVSTGAAALVAGTSPRAVADPGLAAVAYAGIRVVRAVPGVPSVPEITLPAGYSLLPQYQVASRAEFLCFVQGERNDAGIEVSVRWPGERIETVVAGERRLPPERFTLPVFRATPVADSPTVQVWSHLSRPTGGTGLYWHVEHNDPDRAAGYWATVPWPVGQTMAVVSWMAATREVLDGAGLLAEARRRGHFYALMGFETNNPMHQDNPPHWHMSYYPGPTMGAAKATVPHFWIDAYGRTFYNGQDVQGSGRTPYRVGQPAPIVDADGLLVVTTTIRADGGLDIDPPAGPRYSIVSPAGNDFTGRLRVLRDGKPWRAVGTYDDVRKGRLRIDVQGFGAEKFHRRATHHYDRLTGVLTTPPSR